MDNDTRLNNNDTQLTEDINKKLGRKRKLCLNAYGEIEYEVQSMVLRFLRYIVYLQDVVLLMFSLLARS